MTGLAERGRTLSKRLFGIARKRRTAVVGFLVLSIVVVTCTIGALDRRRSIYASYNRELGNLGIALAEQTVRALQAVDLVLRETQADVQAAATSPPPFSRTMATEQLHALLARHSQNLPQMAVLGVIGSGGRLLNDSRHWPAIDANFAEWQAFRRLRDHDDPTVSVSRPVYSPLTGGWTFFLARRLNGPHHEFLGIVIAGVRSAYFEEFYRALSLHRGGSIALMNSNGMILARYPQAKGAVGNRLPADSRWFSAVRADGGDYRSRGVIDGNPRLVSVHPLRDYPLVVTVTAGEADVFAEWRRQSLLVLGCGIGAAAGLLAVFGVLSARSRKLETDSARLVELTRALRTSEARFRDYALTSSDWFWETDQDHRFTFVSEGIRAFGRDPDRYRGCCRLEISAASDRDDQKWDEHRAALDRHEPFRSFVYTLEADDKAESAIETSGNPFFDTEERFLGYRGSARDITEVRLAERRLHEAKAAAEAANQAKTQFLANVSHELRTPLNAILGFSEMLELGMVGPLKAKQTEYVGLIRQSGNHLLQVISDILDFAKVDAGKLEIREETGIDPRRIVEACCALVKERARRAELQLSVSVEEPAPPIVGDSLRLKQILLNLLSNAVKFTDPGGSVTVSVCRNSEGGIVFAVRDTGAGMTPDELSVAMEPFGQVDGGLTRLHEGTGLGLPLARRLAELHDGSLLIESAKGEGTVVSLVLPPSRVMASAAEASPTRSAA